MRWMPAGHTTVRASLSKWLRDKHFWLPILSKLVDDTSKVMYWAAVVLNAHLTRLLRPCHHRLQDIHLPDFADANGRRTPLIYRYRRAPCRPAPKFFASATRQP